MSALPLDEWAAAVRDVSEGTQQALRGLESLCDLCLRAGPSAATEAYRRRAGATGRAFLQALEGTAAMADGLAAVPEELRDAMPMSRSLMGLLYGQMVSYYKEMDTAAADASKGFVSEKAAAFGTSAPPRSGGTTPRRASTSEVDVEKKEKKETKEKKDKKDKKKKDAAADAEGATPEGGDEGGSASEVAALSEAILAPKRADSAAATSKLPFIKVRNSLNDSLGVAVITTRPDVYLPFERIVTEAAVSADTCALRYYLACDSLPTLLTTVLNSTSQDAAFAEKQQEATLDLLCDALVSEDINVLPFCNASGEVRLDGSAPLPSCAWRTADGVAEGAEAAEATMDTFVAFIDHMAIGLGPCLIFHDALVRSEDEREQIVHVIRPVPGAVGLLEVSAHSPPPALLEGAANAGALASLYRRFFTAFFDERPYSPTAVVEPEFNSMSDTLLMRKANSDASALQAQRDAAEAKAAKAKKGKGGIIGLTKAIAASPITAVNALNEASQAAAFRRNFPEHQDEEVITSYNCAWSEGGKVIRQGYLFATTSHLCFHSTVLAGRFVLAYDDIEGMRKAKNAMFDNSIEIEDCEGTTYFLTSFVARDDAYKALFRAWTTSR